MDWDHIRLRRPLNVLLLLCFTGVVLSGCIGPSVRQGPYRLGDEALRPFAAMYAVDRNGLCLTEIARDAEVYVDTEGPGERYDVILRIIADGVSRSVFFVWEDQRYVWIGETEIHYSGRKYTFIDTTVPEQIVISYYERPIYGGAVGLRISYWGDEDWPSDMTCDEAHSYIRKWRAN